MTEVVIVVKGGMVQNVYSNEKDVDVTVLDLDTEDGMELEAEIVLPEHQVY